MSDSSKGLLVLWSLWGIIFRSSKVTISIGLDDSVTYSRGHLDFPFNTCVSKLFKIYADYLSMLTACLSDSVYFSTNA